jgi:hypothetical protein
MRSQRPLTTGTYSVRMVTLLIFSSHIATTTTHSLSLPCDYPDHFGSRTNVVGSIQLVSVQVRIKIIKHLEQHHKVGHINTMDQFVV